MKITDRIAKLVLARKPEIGPRGFKRDIATTCGVSYEAVRQWFAGDTGNIKNENLVAIAEGYDTTVDWLLSGKGEPPSRKAADAPKTGNYSSADLVKQMLAKHGRGLSDEARTRIAEVVEDVALESKSTNVVKVDFTRAGQVGDEVWIAHYDVRAAMGGGQIPHEFPEMLQDIRVSPKHLREMGVSFKEHFHLKMITGWGQSMAPTIKDRDPLLVDITIREFTGDGIYLFSHDDMLYVKRLQKKGKDRFKMISDNKHHDPEDIRADDTHILARVLYVWNGQPV
ncbi:MULTISPECIES: XRE family transcriptional regulator [unclassified Pseudomonas]|uniref:XRE family transcriptional regulator n=1 Tax=unclassified Pseudomonas TaxID=196821 RepID=UPI001F20048A|nr:MULTISPECIES: XRE family transcriptional regulator [unclassified Pseudomonas]MCF5228562.1 helix-turn-helix domain-containing protein [Pseudomonas sp. PA-5-4H]MCF5236213.1 helix-turn-helix domain-containing protein [Pseudomonas sp. PA-5-4G]MCF5247421.1 helix-turn-helix domain-containing protein [Pseudomonas sp. PA-5-4B]MCF5253571.1 helix-turn-helix domain-containing protein [Pseudomonas sp. PA-5-4B]MCF5263287.1 helix-turn-helix domain-containing protein [Pseudomonas sp. PA-5-4A]